MDNVSRIEQLLTGRPSLNRREFLKRSAVLGTGVPLFGSLLSACSLDDDAPPNESATETIEPTPTVTRVVPTAITSQETPTTEGTGDAGSPTPSLAEPTPTAAEGTPSATESAEEEPRQGGTLRALGHHEVTSLSPDDWQPAVHFFLAGNIHDRLLRLDPHFRLVPSLCESFEVSDDGLEYTFHLREGLTFHEGEAFTAADVKYTFDFRRDPANGATTAHHFASIETIDTPDPLTVVITMRERDAAFLTLAGQAGIVSESYHSAIGEQAYSEAPNGLGPFKYKEWRPDEFTELEAFDDYWAGRPYLNGIRLDVVPEALVRGIALDTGEADTSIGALTAEDHIRFRDDPDFVTFATSSLALNHFPLNNRHPILREKAVRQAMLYAIDRDQIIDSLWEGLAIKATAHLSPAFEYYYTSGVRQYPYDPELASRLLDGAGWEMDDSGVRVKGGIRCAVTCTVIARDQVRMAEAEAVQEYFAAVGIEMLIDEAPLEDLQEGLLNGSIDMSLFDATYGGGSGEPDGSTALKSWQPHNWSRWSHPRVDELCELGLEETDPEVRQEIYSEIQQIVAEEVPFLFILYPDRFTIFNPRVQGLPEEPLAAGAIYQEAFRFWIDD